MQELVPPKDEISVTNARDGSEMKSYTARQAYHFKASPERVFKALTDQKGLESWFLSRAKLTPMKGGTYSFDWLGGYHMTGKVKRYEPNKAVSFSWTDNLKDGTVANTTATFRVAKKGKGTVLNLQHSGFKDPEHFADCSSRWGYYLTNMKSVLDHRVDLRSRFDW